MDPLSHSTGSVHNTVVCSGWNEDQNLMPWFSEGNQWGLGAVRVGNETLPQVMELSISRSCSAQANAN